jgi:hypothetical protein
MSATFNGNFDIPGFREAWRKILGSSYKYAVLEVASDVCVGAFNIYCGRYITGAQTPHGMTGVAAFLQMFETPQGRFNYREAQHPFEGPGSQQSFMIDIYDVLDLLDELAADGCLYRSARLTAGLERLASSLPWEPPAEFDATAKPRSNAGEPELTISQVAAGAQAPAQNAVGETISALLDELFSPGEDPIQPAEERFDGMRMDDSTTAIAV